MDKQKDPVKVFFVVSAIVVAIVSFAYWWHLPSRPTDLPGTDVWLDRAALVPLQKPTPQVKPPPGPPPVPSYPDTDAL